MMKASAMVSIVAARIIDVVLIAATGWWLSPSDIGDHTVLVYAAIVLLAALVSLFVMPSFGIYHSWRGGSLINLLGKIFIAWSVITLVVIAGLFLSKSAEDVSRLWLISWWVSVLLLMILTRVSVYVALGRFRQSGANRKRVLLFGSQSSIDYVVAQLAAFPSTGFVVEGQLETHQLDALFQSVVGFEELWLLLSFQEAQLIDAILERLSQSTVNIRWLPDNSKLFSVWQEPRYLIGLPVLDLRVSPMAEPFQRLLKGLEDRVLAAMILLLISPFMLVLAFGVKVSSSGPVFYRQQRHGWNGEAFEMLKFRSMVVHTEDNGQVTQATEGDARITPFGAFLRRTSLDELPQFFNVLKGDMSIVGPRPH
ncbi:MAG: exopolysaccharide biosynthesis polyprenyl glycosylphosphotransferase, partial [Thiotrichales bacterium]|nr:exopolysaccharide biosynthesis polyprenyl glycosylphosphotransferase [Thiotrichales bacterium]